MVTMTHENNNIGPKIYMTKNIFGHKKKLHLLLYFYITTLLIFSNCYISNDNMTINNPKNIILMIGDGMGLSQISGAMYTNDNFLFLEEAKHIGLVKTHSHSSIITDSAAGATAFSTGEKTYNGSINMNTDTMPLTPITKTLIKQNVSPLKKLDCRIAFLSVIPP